MHIRIADDDSITRFLLEHALTGWGYEVQDVLHGTSAWFDDQNYWQRVEDYISQHADVSFTHGICPGCLSAQLGKRQA